MSLLDEPTLAPRITAARTARRKPDRCYCGDPAAIRIETGTAQADYCRACAPAIVEGIARELAKEAQS